MIQKAIVEAIENDYQIRVRIPKYDKLSNDGSSYDDLSIGIVCSAPGTIVNYSVGDIVLVGFENDEISKPVVLGLLYTENNTGDSIKFPELSERIEKINDSVNKLKFANSFIHIKYSNDGGSTFTSLYDYSEEEYDPVTDTYSASQIEINPKSSYLMWDITDASNANAFKNIYLYTTIQAEFLNGEIQQLSSEDFSITLPSTFRYANKVYVSYELKVLTGRKSSYNIALFTDINEIGSIEGDYIGFYYSTNQLASYNPIDYAWASIKVRVQKFIDAAYNSLLKRVQENELYLYGTTADGTANNERGLNSAIQVYVDSLDLSFKPSVVLTEDESISINTQENYINLGEFKFGVTNKGHLRLRYGGNKN